MKRITKSLLSVTLVLALCFSMLTIPASAASSAPYSSERNGTSTFYNLNRLQINESVTQEFLDHDGNPASITITRVATKARSSNTWLISLDSVAVDAEYYVDVTNNKITNAYNWSIYTFVYDYSDVSLSYTSSYARLSFKASIAGVYSGTCWLQATIRGTNNEVDVTHFV